MGGETVIGLVVEQHHRADHPLLEVLPRVVHLVLGQLVLLVVLVVHEDELVLLAVEELGVDFGDVGRFQRVAPLVGPVEHGVAEQIPQPALVEGVAFARLDEIALDHQVGVAVDLDLQSPS